jgi:RING finger/CHY zinc finger protein 1
MFHSFFKQKVCHDEQTNLQHGPMNRFEVNMIECKQCHMRQSPSNTCMSCGIQFGEYYCDICRLWMASNKQPFHCSSCGICRVGGRDNFRHCMGCSMCLNTSLYDDHICIKDKYKDNCPVCREDIFSSRVAPLELPCGHVIHATCLRKLAHYDFRCPICKKTVVDKDNIKSEWESRARDIASQPMPPDLAKNVDILCYDCNSKSYQLSWHFLGVQCPSCESFNTVLMNRDTSR